MSQSDEEVLKKSGTFILLDFPPGSEFGIDLQSWTTGERFRGVKLIPTGSVHYIYWRSVDNAHCRQGPLKGMFHIFSPGEVVARRYDKTTEDVVDVTREDLDRLKLGLCELDRFLGPYPFEMWKKWISLTSRISSMTVARLMPRCGYIDSVCQLVPNEHRTSRADKQSTSRKADPLSNDRKIPSMDIRDGTGIEYVAIPDERYPAGSDANQISRHCMDSSYRLELYIQSFARTHGDSVSSSMTDISIVDEIFGELQFAFTSFLVGQHYDSFEQWKRIVELFCNSFDALLDRPQYFMDFTTELYFQIQEVPDDFLFDIVANNNFLVASLKTLFNNARDHRSPNSEGRLLDDNLDRRLRKFMAFVSKKFDFSFDQYATRDNVIDESDEYAPVVVTDVL